MERKERSRLRLLRQKRAMRGCSKRQPAWVSRLLSVGASPNFIYSRPRFSLPARAGLALLALSIVLVISALFSPVQ